MDRDFLSKLGILALLLSALGFTIYFSTPLPSQGKTVVRFLTYETGQEQMALVSEIERRFEEQNPDIDVQVEFNARARDKIYVEMASNTAPDTFYVVTDDIPRLAHKDAIAPLNELIKGDRTADLSVFFPRTVNALMYPQRQGDVLDKEGLLYAYPIHFSTDILFYNEDAFKEAGVELPRDDWTWDEMLAAARKLQKRDKSGRIARFGMFLPDPVTTIQSNGGDVFNADYTRCIINSPESIEAMETLRDIRFKENLSPTPAQVQETSSMQMFKLGQLAMMPGRTYMVVDFNKIKDFKYNVTLMPGMKRSVERLAVGGVAISKQSKVKEAVWEWTKFYCDPAGGGEVLGTLKNCVTAIEEYAFSPKFFMQSPPENCRVLVTSLKASVITVPPIVNAAEYINRIRNPMFDDMLRAPDRNIRKMLKEYEDKTNALLATEPKGAVGKKEMAGVPLRP